MSGAPAEYDIFLSTDRKARYSFSLSSYFPFSSFLSIETLMMRTHFMDVPISLYVWLFRCNLVCEKEGENLCGCFSGWVCGMGGEGEGVYLFAVFSFRPFSARFFQFSSSSANLAYCTIVIAFRYDIAETLGSVHFFIICKKLAYQKK